MAQSVILLVRSPQPAERELLDILDHAKANSIWLAAGNVLINKPPAGFAALLLGRFTQHITVSVTDGVGGAAGSGVSGCTFPLDGQKIGWPRVAVYKISQFPGTFRLPATFLVGGETPVYYWRAEVGNYINPLDASASGCRDGNRDQYRLQYLRKIPGPFTETRLDAYPQVIIAWHGEQDYLTQIATAIRGMDSKFRAVIRLLKENGRLTAEEAAALEPRLEVRIEDRRRDRSVPLPKYWSDYSENVRPEFSEPLL